MAGRVCGDPAGENMTQSDDSARSSRAQSPDLDWSQVQETVLMLELAAGQIEAAMKDGDASVEVLTDSFTSMAGYVRMLSAALEELPDSPELATLKETLVGQAAQVRGMVQHSIVAFQFYDKLVQRLAHVGHSLGALSSLVSDRGRLYNPLEWVALQEKIRAKYSTREEVEMFEAVMQGIPVKEALQRFKAGISATDADDGVEFF